MAHIVGATHRRFFAYSWNGRFLVVQAEIKKYHIGILISADDVETIVIARFHQLVVGINELQELTLGYLDAFVTCSTRASVFLTNIDDRLTIWQ